LAEGKGDGEVVLAAHRENSPGKRLPLDGGDVLLQLVSQTDRTPLYTSAGHGKR